MCCVLLHCFLPVLVPLNKYNEGSIAFWWAYRALTVFLVEGIYYVGLFG